MTVSGSENVRPAKGFEFYYNSKFPRNTNSLSYTMKRVLHTFLLQTPQKFHEVETFITLVSWMNKLRHRVSNLIKVTHNESGNQDTSFAVWTDSHSLL